MLTRERQEEIAKLVQQQKSVTVSELTQLYNASESTIRRDIVTLHQNGRVLKVFGGAIALTAETVTSEPSVQEKENVQVAEKKRIAKYAASLIAPNDLVYIDAGTTTECMIPHLTAQGATYVTNAISHAITMAEMGLDVVLIGGKIRSNTRAIAGADAMLNLKKYYFTKGFFGANGASVSGGFTTYDINEASIKKTAVENTNRNGCYVLVDSSKFGVRNQVTFAEIDKAIILTEKDHPELLNPRCNGLVVEE